MKIDEGKPLYRVRVRGGFSDRNGINVENTQIQYEKFDERTKNVIKNAISEWYDTLYGPEGEYGDNAQYFFKNILRKAYARFVDGQTLIEYDDFFKIIHSTIDNGRYDEVLSLIEYIAQFWEKGPMSQYIEAIGNEAGFEENPTHFIYHYFNEIFEKEYVGYRFVNDIIAQITDENEIDTIEQASNTEFDVINEHIQKAIHLISDREHPDYENSIKESISAVEAMCVLIIGEKGTLGDALKRLENKGVAIHPSLKSAFQKLFGYTSDANGIRHAGDIGGSTSTFEEAKFMLVSCSAFINYLTGVRAD